MQLLLHTSRQQQERASTLNIILSADSAYYPACKFYVSKGTSCRETGGRLGKCWGKCWGRTFPQSTDYMRQSC
ncbi:hypothetical protein XELAEV_18002643mg [Xenopus laevis]|uniref:Uncharacterized protein n=1 Tax=Xenopus laevis TaxID=8355 RepID=A0A974BPN4_XENLA|nr:hypothetical protein XELAEV_18002643mg [Xenopus laevis]